MQAASEIITKRVHWTLIGDNKEMFCWSKNFIRCSLMCYAPINVLCPPPGVVWPRPPQFVLAGRVGLTYGRFDHIPHWVIFPMVRDRGTPPQSTPAKSPRTTRMVTSSRPYCVFQYCVSSSCEVFTTQSYSLGSSWAWPDRIWREVGGHAYIGFVLLHWEVTNQIAVFLR